MKKILILSGLLFVGFNLYAEKRTATFTVNPPLVCNNCETKVKENLRFEKGVSAVKPSAKKGIVEITYDDSKTNVEALKEGFKKIGYEATVNTPGQNPEVCPEPCSSPSCE